MDVAEIIERYLAHLRYLNRRPSVVSKRAWALRQFARFVAPASVLEADAETIRRFVSRESLGAEARNNAISHVRGFYRWAIRHGYIDEDPTALLERPRRPRRLPRPMPTDAVTHALNTAPDPIRQWLYLATYAGLRACEIAQLSGADFNLTQSPPVLIVQESKGGDTQFAVLAAELLEVASELSIIRGWCFPKGVGDPSQRAWFGHVSAGQVQKRANQFLHDNGIPQTLHQLRHWYGTELLVASGGNLRIAQEGLRHRDANSTAIYTFAAPGEIARALNLLPRLTG